MPSDAFLKSSPSLGARRALLLAGALASSLLLLLASSSSSVRAVPLLLSNADSPSSSESSSSELPVPLFVNDRQALLKSSNNFQDDIRYGLMIDAGSSGSRIYAYAWNNGDPTTIRPYPETNGYVVKVKPGISAFADRDADLVAYLDGLIGPSLQQGWIPAEARNSTPIFLRATGGMRLLYMSNPGAADHIYSVISSYFANTGYKFDLQDGAKTIAGEQEAIFGWVSVNQALGLLGSNRRQTAVSFDLGGASSQISFIPNQDPLLNLYELILGNRYYPLYAHSYLRFHDTGKDSTDKRDDPCYPSGHSYQYLRPSDSKSINYTGSGDFSDCRTRVKGMMGLDTFCGASPCAIYGNYQSQIPADRLIVARDNFADVASFFGVPGEQSLNTVKKAIKKKCEADLTDKQAAKVGDNCLHGAYVYSVLKNGYNLETDRTIFFQDAIGAENIGWQYGAMMYEAFREIMELKK